jgi:hypothetical protein
MLIRRAVTAFLALLLTGCASFPLPMGCSSTWFRSCGPARDPGPVPLSSSAPAGEFHGEFPFSWVTRGGILYVTVSDLPGGSWLVQARRPGGWVVGSFEIIVPSGNGVTEIEIWGTGGRPIAPDAFPVFIRG